MLSFKVGVIKFFKYIFNSKLRISYHFPESLASLVPLMGASINGSGTCGFEVKHH
jgi:hypothetical protein